MTPPVERRNLIWPQVKLAPADLSAAVENESRNTVFFLLKVSLSGRGGGVFREKVRQYTHIILHRVLHSIQSVSKTFDCFGAFLRHYSACRSSSSVIWPSLTYKYNLKIRQRKLVTKMVPDGQNICFSLSKKLKNLQSFLDTHIGMIRTNLSASHAGC